MHTIRIDFNLRGRSVLVVGGEATLAPGLRFLFKAGAYVRIVAETIDDDLQDSFRAGCGVWERRRFAPRDLHDAVLAVVATGDAQRDLEVARAARAARVPVAIPARPELSDFTLAARGTRIGIEPRAA